MRYGRITESLLILSMLICRLPAQDGGAYPKTAVVSGTIIDRDGAPISYANVFISSTKEGQVADDNGRFSFTTKAEGEVQIIASAVGYRKCVRSMKIVPGKVYHVDVNLDEAQIVSENVDVTASSFASDPGKGLSMTSMDVYTTPGGAADIFQSLKTLPGLTQVSESSELYVRGGDPSETLVLLDQSSLYNPYAFESPHGGLFSNLNTSAIGGMYFSSGGFSAKYGNALSGVLDLQTKGIPENQTLQLGICLAGASVGIEIPMLEDRLGIRVYARKSFTKPIFWLNGGLDSFSSMPTSQDAEASLTYKYSQSGTLKTFLLVSADDEGVNVDRPEFDGVFSGESRNYSVNLQHTEMIGEKMLVSTSLSGSDYEDTWLLGVLNLDRIDRTRKLRSDVEDSQWDNTRLFFGGELETREEEYTGRIPNYDYDLRPQASSEVLDATFSAIRYGAYAELEEKGLASVPSLFLVAGLRGDYVGKLRTSWVDPRFTAGYNLSSVSTLRFAFGLFHECPDPRLYSSSDGNPNLLSMKALHCVIGYDYTPWEGTEIRVELYQKEYSGLPDSNSILNFDNSGYGYARGVDVIAKGDLQFGLSGWISYGYMDTKRKWYESAGFAPSPFDITNNFTLVAKYNIVESWQVGVDFKYATGMPYTPVVGSVYRSDLKVYEPIHGNSYSARYPDYRRLDVRVTYLTKLFDRYFAILYAEGINVLDIHNIFAYAFSPDYSAKTGVKSYFGRRTIVLGAEVNIQ
jgi:vitamin B12 transporter